MNLIKDLQTQFKHGTTLNRLIFINIAVFALINIFALFSWLVTQSVTSAFTEAIMANIQTYLNPEVLIRKPWTLITYMFVHKGFLHLLFNMLWLFWFGRIFIDMLKGKRLFAVYVLGGIFGALFAVAMFQIIPALQAQAMMGTVSMIGASAAVLAVVVATATYFPNYQVFLLFFGQVRLKYLALVMVALDIISVPGLNSGGVLSHLGGALFGVVWAWQLKQGNDIAAWFGRLCDWFTGLFAEKPKMRVSYRNKKSNISDVQFEEIGKVAASQAEIDVILDKISKHGYDSLTKREKDLLFHQKM
ncbi:MAG: rhomboid family intramembrane serine protease [Bacteroidetes bacterium]|nr:rhomboid family intramembrane serine protease [Bacteroidota bacterium]